MDAPHGGPLISVEDALDRVLRHAVVLPPEQVALAASHGRVLARGAVADADVPPFDRCAMDGWAFRSADTRDAAAAPVRLRCVGTAPAGGSFAQDVGTGEAVRVMTGAPLPRGCDAVEARERVDDEQTHVLVKAPVTAGQHVAPAGQDLRAGSEALAAGTLIGPAQVALLATLGHAEVAVHGRPLAAVVSTGDELVEVGERPGPGRIRNSNGPMLAVLARMLGCDPVHLLPVVADDHDRLATMLARGLASDLLLVSGGVSMGERDLVQVVLPELGVERIFHGVSIQPGKPLWFGRTERCLVFALPGNPVSALTTARLFAGAAVRRMRGLREPRPQFLRARLTDEVRRRSGRVGYLPGWARSSEDGSWSCEPITSNGSADVVAASRANATWVAPAGRDVLERGAEVDVLLHVDFWER